MGPQWMSNTMGAASFWKVLKLNGVERAEIARGVGIWKGDGFDELDCCCFLFGSDSRHI